MKNKFTKLLVIIAVLFLSIESANAQANIYPGTFPLVMTGFDALLTSPKAAGWMINSSTTPSNTSRTDKCFPGALAEVNMNSTRFVQYRLPKCGSITISTDGTTARGLWITAKDASSTPLTVTRTEALAGIPDNYLVVGSGTGNTGTCTSMTFNINTPNEVIVKVYSPSSTEMGGGITSSGSTYISSITFTEPVVATPIITSFTADGVSAAINQTAKTITAELPYGTSLSSITPTVTIGGTATSYSPTGAQDFSNSVTIPVIYTVIGTPSNVDYAVTLIVPAAPPAPIFNVTTGSSNQSVKAGSVITPLIYSLTNATGANVTGLPDGLTGLFQSTGTNSGTFTISGTVNSGVSPGTFDFVITAIPIIGFPGDPVTTTGSIYVKDQNAVDILYLATDATTPANDLFLAQLIAKPTFLVTKRQAQASFAGNYDPYELIVLHESLTGGDAATTGHELRLIKDVDKPILNLKSYFYSTGRWSWGTPNNGNSSKGVKVTQPSHPILSGITYSDSIYLYGSLRAKNIQPVVLSVSGFEIANVVGGVAIHDLPASIRIPSGSSKYLLVSLLNGAFNDLTPDALKLLDNAVNYLLLGSQFAGIYTGTSTVNNINISFDGQTLINPDKEAISVFDIAGRHVISSNIDINMSTQAKGIYIVRSDKGLLKIALTK